MSAARLAAKLVVQACIRAAEAKGLPATVLRRGDPDAGTILLKALDRHGMATLYTQARSPDGELGWRMAAGLAPAAESDVDARIAREANIDPDVWAVEVLDDERAHPLNPSLERD